MSDQTVEIFRENIRQIIYCIHNKNDYEQASKIMLENNISLRELCQNTLKLSIFEVARLADDLIKKVR